MIKQNIQKIKILLKDRSYFIPQILYKFYSYILVYSEAIEQKGGANVFNAVSIYSDIFKLYKKYIVDEPFHLKKLKIPKIAESLDENNFQSFFEIFKLRDELSKQIQINIKNDQILTKIIQQMTNLKWAKQLKQFSVQSQSIKQLVNKNKNKNNDEMSQMTNLIWYRQFKNQYLVKVDYFIDYFVKFCQEKYALLVFVNRFTKKIFKELVDPERKCFITRINVQDFIQKLREPQTLKKIYNSTKQQVQQEPFQSSSSLKIKIYYGKNLKQQIFEINGDKVTSENGQKLVKHRGIVMMGSSIDNEIVIKSNYISRRQLMIIQDHKSQIKQNDNFSMVCLSLTNSTGFKNIKKTKVTIGMIFQYEDIKYQILTIQKDTMPIVEPQIIEERTLSILPGEKGVSTNEKISFLILNGANKEKQFSISSHNIEQISEQSGKQQDKIRKILEYSKYFYLQSGVKIFLKGANEIIQNRISKKIRLTKGMQIPLQQFIITIL